MNIIRIKSITSTNTHLKELLLRQKLENGTVVIADSQTAGRGQAGNNWESEPDKNLTFSVILRPSELTVDKNFMLSRIISLSIKETLDEYSPNFRIKWPNDIYYEDKKIAGILIENDIIGNKITQSVIGVGININQEFFYSDAPNPVSLKQIIGSDSDINSVLMEVLERLMKNFDLIERGEYEVITKNYFLSLYRNDRYSLFSDKNGIFKAIIIAVEDNGKLVLKTEEGEKCSYFFKEVIYLN